MIRIALAAALTLAAGAAYAQFNRCGPGFCPGGMFGMAFPHSVPPPADFGLVLMTDGTSKILQTDAASRICQAGGC